MIIGINDLFESYGKTSIEIIREFSSRFNPSKPFKVGCVQLDRKISSNQAHDAIDAGLKAGIIEQVEDSSYRIKA